MNNYGRETRQEHAPVLRNERESHSLPTFEPSEKLRGYDWYRSIGSPRYIVAPMVDQSELGYRMLTREYGADLVYTQMFNAPVFARDKQYRMNNFRTCEGDRPLIVQFAGHDPASMLAAAKIVEDKCDAAFALEAAKKVISNHEAIALDCTNQDPRSQKNIGRSVDKGNAEQVIQKVAEILLKGNEAIASAKTFPLEDFKKNSRNDAAIAARTIASRLCTPRDMSAPAAKILRGVLMIVAERLESETREKKRTKILNAAKNLFARLKV